MRLFFVALFAAQLACAGSTSQSAPSAEPGATPAPSSSTPATAENQAGPASRAAVTKDGGATDTPSGDAVQLFLNKVKEYVALRKKVDNGVPALKETNNPTEIAAREKALGEALIKARATAQPGDVFVKEFQPVLAAVIKQDFAKRTAAERKALIIELPKGVKVAPNMMYPSTIPLATFPANLLKALPELPDELEYRIVYRHLILHDVHGNYIVDMVPDVLPIPM